MKRSANRKLPFNAAESQTPCMRGNSMRENRETHRVPTSDGEVGRSGKAEPKPDAYALRESDGVVVPTKQTNKAWDDVPDAAESVEERTPTKGNVERTRLAPDTVPAKRRGMGLPGIRKAARGDKQQRFTAVLHHVNPELLRASFFNLKKNAAPGVDGVTWNEYRCGLDRRIADLHGRIHRGAYRAQPSKRQYIPKPDGRQRPLGIAALEDKIVQQAVRVVLEQIYEEDFVGFSYGFRAGRGGHSALDALYAGIQRRKRSARGDVIIVRYADDFVLGFQHRSEAERFLRELHKRLEAFGLELHSEKTRLIEFGRFAERNRRDRGDGRPETFDFLGFTHYCGKTRGGRFVVKRRSIGKRLRAKLHEIKLKLRRKMHQPLAEQGRWLQRVVRGWFNYHAVPLNGDALETFRTQVIRLWCHVIRRRSQKARRKWIWKRMRGLVQRWIPPKRILHPYPDKRLIVTT